MSKLLTDALLEEATQLAQQLQDDIKLASTRIEHVRLTARANEAALLAERLKELNKNDVDTETQETV
jgi:hypothetical protein